MSPPPNGTAVNGGVNTTSNTTNTTNLRHVCLDLQRKLEAFLAQDVDTKLLKAVQAQVKDALAVIDEALDKYRYAPAPAPWKYN